MRRCSWLREVEHILDVMSFYLERHEELIFLFTLVDCRAFSEYDRINTLARIRMHGNTLDNEDPNLKRIRCLPTFKARGSAMQ